MAKLGSNFDFIGSLGPISAYKMRGVEGIVVRKKGGASKEKVKNSPRMEGTRRGNSEFGGRATAGKWIRSVLFRQLQMADYNVTGAINSLMTPIQKLDTVHPLGQRDVAISKNPWLLEGFSLNKEKGFDSFIRNPLTWSVSREALSARIELPALLPGINLLATDKYPMFGIVASLGMVPDFFYSAHGFQPSSRDYSPNHGIMSTVDTGWFPTLQGSPAMPLELTLSTTPPDQSFSLLLSIGIRFGAMINANTVQQVKQVGAAKILGMG